ARAGDRLPPCPHARTAAARGSARGSLPHLAGAGTVLRTRPARDSPAARGGDEGARFALRRQGVSRPRAGGRGGAAAPVAGEHRAMDRRRALVLVAAWSAAGVPPPVLAQTWPVTERAGPA